MLLDNITGSLADLDPETRAKLAELFEARHEYFDLKKDEMRRKAALLRQRPFNAAAEAELAEFSSMVVAPARLKAQQLMVGLLPQVVNVEQAQAMLPSILMGLMTALNLPLILAISDLDLDLVMKGAEEIKKYFSESMND